MSLKCKNCGGRETVITSAKELSKKTGLSDIMTAPSGYISPETLLVILKLLKTLAVLFGWLKKKEEGSHKVILCKDCGHWEKL